jgi:hypothetical protein
MARGALEGERTLSMMVPAMTAARGASGWSGSGDWGGTGSSDIMSFHASIDTSGYTADDLTLFPLGVTLQDPGRYISSNAAVPLQVVDIITTETLNSEDVLAWVQATPTGGNTMPGMLGTTHDWMQIVWGQYRTFLPQATFAGFATEFLAANGALFGSGQPTTADKLHIYRYLIMPGSAEGDTIAVPSSRFIMSAVIVSEDEKAFLMRTKRSYELAT